MSGTSMASPHVAGVAALVKQAAPELESGAGVEAAIVNTGNPSAIGGLLPYRTSRAEPGSSSRSRGQYERDCPRDTGTSTLNFGFSELNANF